MSIANLFQLSVTPSPAFFQWTGAGSIDRQVSQAFTKELAVSLDTCTSTNLAKYKVHFAPGCPLWWWMSATYSLSSRLLIIVQLLSTGSFPSLSKSIHLCGTLVRLSTWFWQDFTSFTSMVSPYSFASNRKVPSRHLTSISPATLMFTHALPVKVLRSTGAHTLNQWPSVTLSPPTEGPNWFLWGPRPVQLDWCAERR